MTRAARRLAPLVAVETTTVLSGISNGITQVALPWLVLVETGSAAGAGVVAAAAALPMILVSLLAGTLVDRLGRRRSAVASDLLSALAVGVIPVVALTADLSVPALAVLAFAGAVFDPAGITAREAMLPAAAKAAGWRLERLNGLHEAAWGLAFVIGPGIAGVLIALVGAAVTLWAVTTVFVLSAVVMALIRVPEPDQGTAPQRRGIRAEAAEGLRFVRRDRMILAFTVFTLLLTGAYMPVELVLLPVWFEQQDAPARLGLVLLVMSLGWLAGSLAYGAWGHRLPRRATFAASALLLGISLIPMALLPPLGIVLASAAALGFFSGPLGPIYNLVLQARTPEHLRGRVLGIATSLEASAGPLGFLLVGPLIDGIGLRPAFLVVAALTLGACASPLVLPGLRDLDELDLSALDHDGDRPPAQPPYPAARPDG